ncbi:hypothetical protein SKAU_G00230160 [Synaphobranchus kaupii]|uniref:Uncharacterized protein n=1 Tax=Synaphobranchus kaupii TaxID=118154 RepID=A0A9Q1F5P0_SYNKA|nr:hypothetical protein SKAU_G00230160 [Synaphobranchus kaupii]
MLRAVLYRGLPMQNADRGTPSRADEEEEEEEWPLTAGTEKGFDGKNRQVYGKTHRTQHAKSARAALHP